MYRLVFDACLKIAMTEHRPRATAKASVSNTKTTGLGRIINNIIMNTYRYIWGVTAPNKQTLANNLFAHVFLRKHEFAFFMTKVEIYHR